MRADHVGAKVAAWDQVAALLGRHWPGGAAVSGRLTPRSPWPSWRTTRPRPRPPGSRRRPGLPEPAAEMAFSRTGPECQGVASIGGGGHRFVARGPVRSSIAVLRAWRSVRTTVKIARRGREPVLGESGRVRARRSCGGRGCSCRVRSETPSPGLRPDPQRTGARAQRWRTAADRDDARGGNGRCRCPRSRAARSWVWPRVALPCSGSEAVCAESR